LIVWGSFFSKRQLLQLKHGLFTIFRNLFIIQIRGFTLCESNSNEKNSFPMPSFGAMFAFNSMAETEARNNINDGMKRKIVFPDGNTIVIEREDDIQNLFRVRDKIEKYICSLDFDMLKKINIFYISYYHDLFNIRNERDVLYLNVDFEKIIGSLKKNGLRTYMG
jgi:hypothetical protein